MNNESLILFAKNTFRLVTFFFVALFTLVGSISYAGDNVWTTGNDSTNFSNSIIATDGAGYVYSTYPWGLIRSTNSGVSWSSLYVNGLSFAKALVVSSSGTVYVASSISVFRSYDRGATWSSSLTREGSSCSSANYVSSEITTLALDKAGNIYVGTNYCGVYKSVDQGTTWTWISATLGGGHANVEKLITDSYGNVYARVMNVGLMKSTGGSGTWTNVGGTYDNDPMASDGMGNIYIGNQSGTYKSNGGSSWERLGPGIVSFAITVDANNYVYTSTAHGIYKSINGGASWTLIPNTGVNGIGLSMAVGIGSKPTIYITTPFAIYQYTPL